MSVSHSCPCTEACSLQHAMEMTGGKWKLPILCALTVDGPNRGGRSVRSGMKDGTVYGGGHL